MFKPWPHHRIYLDALDEAKVALDRSFCVETHESVIRVCSLNDAPLYNGLRIDCVWIDECVQ